MTRLRRVAGGGVAVMAQGQAQGRLAENILYFRAARCAPPAFPVGSGSVLDALGSARRCARRRPRGIPPDAARGVREAARAYDFLVDQAFRILLPQARLHREADRLHAAGQRRRPRQKGRRRAPSASRRRCLVASTSARTNPRSRSTRGLTVSDRESLAKERLRAEDRGRDRRRQTTRSALPLDLLRTRRLAPSRDGHMIRHSAAPCAPA